MIFWILLVALALIAAWLIVLPTLRAKPAADTTRQALNAKIFKQRMDELEADYKAGRTDEEDYEALKNELERNFLADMEKAEGQAGQSGQTARGALLSLLLILPMITVLVYKTTGFNAATEEWFAVQDRVDPYIDRLVAGQLDPKELQNIPMADFVYGLQRRAQKQQDLAQLWFVLGNTYLQIQTGDPRDQASMLDNATKALRRAHYLEEDNVEFALSYTQALLSQNQGKLDMESRKILNEVMRQQPNNPSAIMMFSMASYQSGEYEAAIRGWEHLLAMGGEREGYEKAQAILENSIRQARSKLEAQHASAGGPELSFVVKVADDINPNLQQGFLMVYAQAEAGPPMPLAIKKLSLPQQFPVSVSLSDADAMMPAMKVSLFESVKITARLSESGQATPQAGDWFGTVTGVRTTDTANDLEITISEQVN